MVLSHSPRHDGQVKATGEWIREQGARSEELSFSSLLCGPGTHAGNGTTYHPRWMDPPTPISEIKIISHRHTQRISQVILDSAMWTININYYTKGGLGRPHPLSSIL